MRGYLADRNSKIEFNDNRYPAGGFDGHTATRDYLAGTTGDVTNARFYDISNRYPAGGFDSSGESLIRFVIALDSGKVLMPETVRQMWTPQPRSDGTRGVFGLG